MTAATLYAEAVVELKRLRATDAPESAEDPLLDQMDRLWRQMSPDERRVEDAAAAADARGGA